MRVSKKQLVKAYLELSEKLRADEEYQQYWNNAVLLGMDVQVQYVLLKKIPVKKNGKTIWQDRFQCDFVVEWDANRKIFIGKPVSLKKGYYEDAVIDNRFYNDGIIALVNGQSLLEDIKRINFEEWPKQIEGIANGSIKGRYKTLTIPSFIKVLSEDSFAGASCSNAVVPIPLLAQLRRSGVEILKEGGVSVVKTHGSGIREIEVPEKRNCTRYKDLFDKNVDLLVYREHLEIQKNKKELLTIPGFKWNRFYETKEVFILSLLFSLYNILTLNIEAGIIDLYHMSE